ncbi:MAG: glycosyltransferase family 2 protein [Acidimicrobiales bacterium]
MTFGQISAVVVAYDSGSALTDCIESLAGAGIGDIVLVDNCSSDGSVALAVAAVPYAVVIRTERNLGFGGGVNCGMKTTSHEFVLVCNSDVSVDVTAVDTLVSTLGNDGRTALVGPRLVQPDGSPAVSARAFPTISRSWLQAFAGILAPGSRSVRRYVDSNRAIAEEGGSVDWVTGACFLVRRGAFNSVGGFDASYFMYVEEVDLCWRLNKAGWQIVHDPTASVTHIGGVSARRRPYTMVLAHHRSLWRFARATAKGPERLALPVVALAIIFRAALVLGRQVCVALQISGRASWPRT